MNLGGKQIDALLESWPAPLPRGEKDEELRWDERADAIVRAARESAGASREELDALLSAPALVPELGEGGVMLLSGEKKMAQDKAAGDATSSTASPPIERKRTSLKEIAARASQSSARSTTGAAPQSSRPSASGTPPPPSILPSRPSSAPPREARNDDSGVINLNMVHAAAQPIVAAEAPEPAQPSKDESVTSRAEQPALATPVKVVGVATKSKAGAIGGIAIAALGIAAAFALFHGKPPAPTPQPPLAGVDVVRPPPPALSGATAATPEPQRPNAAPLLRMPTDPTSNALDTRPAEPVKGVVAAAPLAVGGPAALGKDAAADSRLAAKSASIATPAPGDLQSEMARAVGPSNGGDTSAQAVPVLEPAAGVKNQNIPEQPSQGSVQAALGAVMGAAKACVAGADQVSRAQVTFSSAGTVSSVSVTGWAAAHGKSECIQAALRGATVGPFSRSSYVVPVPIRP